MNETKIKDKNEDGKQSDEQSESQIPITKCRRVLNGAHGGVKVSSTMEVSIMAPGPRTGKQREEDRRAGEEEGKFQLWSRGPRIQERTCTNLQPAPDCFVSHHNLDETGTLLSCRFNLLFTIWCRFQVVATV